MVKQKFQVYIKRKENCFGFVKDKPLGCTVQILFH